MKDYIVDEIRTIRMNIENEFNNNYNEYKKHLLKEQKKFGDKLIRRKPRLLTNKKVA